MPKGPLDFTFKIRGRSSPILEAGAAPSLPKTHIDELRHRILHIESKRGGEEGLPKSGRNPFEITWDLIRGLFGVSRPKLSHTILNKMVLRVAVGSPDPCGP